MARPTLEAVRPVPSMGADGIEKPTIIAIQGAEMASRMTSSLFSAVEKTANSSIEENPNPTNESGYIPTTTIEPTAPRSRTLTRRQKVAVRLSAVAATLTGITGIGIGSAPSAEAAPAPAKAGPVAVAPAFEAHATGTIILETPFAQGASATTIIEKESVKKNDTQYGRAHKEVKEVLGKGHKKTADATEVIQTLGAQLNQDTNPNPDLVIAGQDLKDINDYSVKKAVSFVVHKDTSAANVKTAVDTILKNRAKSQKDKLTLNRDAAQTIFNAITGSYTSAEAIVIPAKGEKTKPTFELSKQKNKENPEKEAAAIPFLQGDIPSGVHVTLSNLKDLKKANGQPVKTVWDLGGVFLVDATGNKKLLSSNAALNAEKALIANLNESNALKEKPEIPVDDVSKLVAYTIPYLNKPMSEVPAHLQAFVRDVDGFAYHVKGTDQADRKDGTNKYIQDFLIRADMYIKAHIIIDAHNGDEKVTPEQMGLVARVIDHVNTLPSTEKDKFTQFLTTTNGVTSINETMILQLIDSMKDGTANPNLNTAIVNFLKLNPAETDEPTLKAAINAILTNLTTS